jgi:hypothetical protein
MSDEEYMDGGGFTERRVDENGDEWLDMYTYNAEAGEVDYTGTIPAHWLTTPDEY